MVILLLEREDFYEYLMYKYNCSLDDAKDIFEEYVKKDMVSDLIKEMAEYE